MGFDVTIVIAVYNDGGTLRRAVESALSSRGVNFEVVVVDDGSTDDGIDNISDLLDTHENLKLVTQENKGLATARDLGIQNSKGNYITFLDADDEIHEDKLSIQLKYLRKNDDSLVFTGVRMIEEDGSEKLVCCKSDVKKCINITDKYCNREVRPPTASMMMPKELYFRQNGFSKNLESGVEFEFLARCISSGVEISLCPGPLYTQYLRKDSLRHKSRTPRSIKELFAKLDYSINKNKEMHEKLRRYIQGKTLEIWASSLRWDPKDRNGIMIIISTASWTPIYYKVLFLLTLLLPDFLCKSLRRNISKSNW